ncbi:MAG: porphobilinogen synthase, partial [Hoeflea sp.]|nr:porphobilinogen synthase [Hoeflea sp.]
MNETTRNTAAGLAAAAASDIDEITAHRRMRRTRGADWSRRLVRETRLTVDDLIWPIFIVPGSGIVEPIAAMPG